MSNIVDAAGKYGGLAGVILALAVLVLVAVIKKKESFDPKVFNLTSGFLIFLALLSVLVLAVNFWGTAAPRTPIVNPQEKSKPYSEPAVKPPEKKQPRVTKIRVSGSVTPIPTVPARVTIVGKPGEWPIDAAGKFDFRVQGAPGEVGEVRILEGGTVVYDGYQDLSRPFSVKISK